MKIDNEDVSVLEYKIKKKELFLLAKFLRQNEEKLPNGLESFYHVLEDSIYNTLSLDEVKRFYS